MDTEVAKITGLEPGTNVVHLKDPKHIEGFGSNVVHVNVSCGQTVPDATSKTTDKAGKSKTQGGAGTPADKEEDDDAQTFIIQLSEEQTR